MLNANSNSVTIDSFMSINGNTQTLRDENTFQKTTVLSGELMNASEAFSFRTSYLRNQRD